MQKDLDIEEYTDPHHDPMIPHTGPCDLRYGRSRGVPQQGEVLERLARGEHVDVCEYTFGREYTHRKSALGRGSFDL